MLKIHLFTLIDDMRKIVVTILAIWFVSTVFAQADTTIKIKTKIVAPPKGNDHFMIQLGYTNWLNKPDSVHTTGLPRTFNFYLMLAFPFKTDPHWSVALGPGIATDNIYFNKTYIGLK